MERDPLKSDNFPVFSHFNSHAHVERDTVREELEQAIKDFNSHAHVERDRRNLCRVLQGKISTHTLTWSVTWGRDSRTWCSGFQLTRSRGAWPVAVRKSIHYLKNFNSHAHVERDPPIGRITHLTAYFNSHAHVERDPKLRCHPFSVRISTHTLTWSVTLSRLLFWEDEPISTHTLTWSVTRNNLNLHNNKYISTHTLTWSVTVQIRQFLGQQTFQLTRSRGAWRTKL